LVCIRGDEILAELSDRNPNVMYEV
jgi:hypothetical protein